jgi:hypothetical protein
MFVRSSIRSCLTLIALSSFYKIQEILILSDYNKFNLSSMEALANFT